MDATVINFAKTCSLESVLFRLYKSFYINYANILFACFACSVINGFYFKSLNFVPFGYYTHFLYCANVYPFKEGKGHKPEQKMMLPGKKKSLIIVVH